jgi:hypothetical protein
MFDVANGLLQIEIDSQECRIPDDVRSRLQPDFERIGQSIAELGRSQLWLMVVYHPRSKAYHAQAKLKLPGETIITGDKQAFLDSAIEGCLQKVLRRIEGYKVDPDREALQRAQSQVAMATDIVAPAEPDAGRLGQAIQSSDYRAFRLALLGHEEWIRKRVGRWIQRYPELQEQIGQKFEIADLVEEVFLVAFEQYKQRPAQISLRDWLDGLIDPAIKGFWHDPDDRIAASFAQTLAGESAT